MKLRTLLLSTLTALTVISCGGGGGTSAGGIGGTGVSYGPVTGYGSLIVNVNKYDTDGLSDYTIEDSVMSNVADDEDVIKVGMMVTIIHDDLGNALSVTYQDNVEGPITTGSINTGAGTFEVLGITIQTDALTNFDGATDLSALNNDDFVEVSGYLVDVNTVQATRVEYKSTGDCTDIEVKGTVENLTLGAGGGSFTIGTLTVNYADSVLDDNLSGGLSDGLFVEVKSTACPVASAITATEIESENEGAEDADGNEIEDADLEIKGIVANLSGSGDNRSFTVNGQVVNTSTGTNYEGGDVNTLADGATVEVEGTLDNAGELQASDIGFEDEEDETIAEVTGIPTAVSIDSYNTGTITLGGVDYLTDMTTIFASETTASFNLSSIAEGTTCIEIKAYDNGSDMVAVKVEEEDSCP